MMFRRVFTGSVLLCVLFGVNSHPTNQKLHNPKQPPSEETAKQTDAAGNTKAGAKTVEGDSFKRSAISQEEETPSVLPIYIHDSNRRVRLRQPGDTPPWAVIERLRTALKDFRLTTPSLIGGEPAGPLSWPWATALFDHQGYFVCGSTLIDARWVITAAHCLNWVTGGGYAAVGAYNISRQAHDAQQYIPIISAHIYSRDDGLSSGRHKRGWELGNNVEMRSSADDVALLQLASRANPDVSIKLPEVGSGLFALNPACYFTGWGVTDPDSQVLSAVLQQVQISVITNPSCQKQWDQSVFSPEIYKTNICTGSGSNRNISTCAGDSGSGLQCFSPALGEWVLAGVSSWSSSACVSYPSVYARVTEYTVWINHVTGTNTFTESPENQ